MSIAKPGAFNLDLFKTKSSPTIAGVATLLTALPHHSIAQANDFVRLHPDEETTGRPNCASSLFRSRARSKTLVHLIDEELAVLLLAEQRIKTAPPRARHQAPRRVLPLPRPDTELRQHVQRELR